MKVTLPKGTTILDLPGAPAMLVADTDVEIAVELSDADTETGVEDYDVVAHDFVAAGRSDLLPILTHKSGNKTVGYTPSGNRVEQSAEEVNAAAKFADGNPDPRVPPNVPPKKPTTGTGTKAAAPKAKTAPATKGGKKGK